MLVAIFFLPNNIASFQKNASYTCIHTNMYYNILL